MDWNPQTLQLLSQSFLDSLSPQPELRRRAEQNLSDTADTPNYGLAVLRLVAEPWVDEQTRECAAINFKNHVKTRWVASSGTTISDGEKEQIKTLMAPLMLSATQKIQAELSQALAVIGNHDFPESWPDLLRDVKSSLEIAINNGILAAVNSLFKRFRRDFNWLFKKLRYEHKKNPILSDLIYCLDNFAAPLLSTVERISMKIAGVGCVASLRELLEARRLCCRIFYSLNFLYVPEEFEDKADEWMNEFKSYLTVAIEDGGDADCVSLVDEVRAAVCENLVLYMEKKEQVLQKHLSDFVEAVCSLLVVASASERLTVSGIKFLSIVVKHVNHHEELFGGYDLLQQIVIPNVMLRDEDLELSKISCIEFIRRDMEEGSTRRRIACELLKGISGEKIKEQIHICLQLFAENAGANWKYKDCAIHLVASLATKKAGGGVASDVVDVESFFRSVIVPELQCEDVNKTFPMLKAAASKFFTVFRVLIPKHVAMPLLGDVVRFVGSYVKVVHSYAAICIEKLLLVKDNHDGVLQARYTSVDIDPIHEDLVYNLLDALKNAPFKVGNEYVARCIMRVFQIADISPEMVSDCIFSLTKALTRVCASGNPKNPVFNHFLFEAVATIVKRTCEKDPGLVTTFQSPILRILELIFNSKVRELLPYVIQLLSQLVDLSRPAPVPPLYMELYDDLLSGPGLWGNSANVPALVGLLQSFLQQAPDELNRERLRHVVGKIEKLVSSPATEEEGFRLLNTVIESYEYGVIAEYMNQIWASLFNRLHTKTLTLAWGLIVFMSLFLVKHGVQTLVDLINSVDEPKLFHVVLSEVWIPYLKTISSSGCNNYTEVKLSAVASTKLLYESPLLLDPAAEELWGKLLDAILTLLSLPLPLPKEERDDDEPLVPDLKGSKFVPLQNAGGIKGLDDPLKEIEDPKQFLVAFPANLSSQFRGRFPVAIMGHLSLPNRDALVKLCNSYNIALV